MDEHTVTLRPPVWAMLIAVIIGGGFYMGGKYIEARPQTDPAMISVEGQGKVTAVPDIAVLSFGVQTTNQKTAKDAMAQLSSKMKAIFDAVKKSGVEEKDITTEQLSASPVYDWSDGKQTLKGYQATQSLRVKVRDLDNVSNVLDAAIEQGANQVGGVQFTMDDPELLRAQAREEAIADAKEKAQKLAAQLGTKLGKLKGFTEGGGISPPYPMMMEAKAMGARDSYAPPIPAGEQDTVITVTLTYEVE